MEYRQFGNTDLVVSAIGFGTWELGGNQYGPLVEEEMVQAMYRAMELGVTCVDTAPIYGHGHSEEVVGKALEGIRKQVILVTKCGLDWGEDKVSVRNGSRERILAGIDESLRRLRTDYVDVFLVHWPDTELPIYETMRAMQDVLASGKARYIGVSNFSISQMQEGWTEGAFHVHQMGYNIFDNRVEKAVIPWCEAHSVGIMAYGSLAYGLLTGTFTAETKFEDWDWRAKGIAFGQALFTPENFSQNLRVVGQLKELAVECGATLPQLAMNWVLRDQCVTVGLTGARRPWEIEDTVKCMGWELTQDGIDRIEEIMRGAVGLVDMPPSSAFVRQTPRA